MTSVFIAASRRFCKQRHCELCQRAGFGGDYREWFIARHDVYGEKFKDHYNTEAEARVGSDVFNFDDALDGL